MAERAICPQSQPLFTRSGRPFICLLPIDLKTKIQLHLHLILISETVKALLAVKAKKIILGSRNLNRQHDFVDRLKQDFAGEDIDERIDGSHCLDLGDLQSIANFAAYVDKTYNTIDCLICNAGIMNTPPSATKDGFEQQMGVNVIGHFLLAKRLVGKTKRQVWVSSHAHNLKGGPRIDMDAIRNFSMEDKQQVKSYDGFARYQQSKLGNILLAKAFSKRYNVETVSLHPGIVYTSLYRGTGIVSAAKVTLSMIPSIFRGEIFQLIPKTASMGAATTVTCATLPADELISGGFYSNCAISSENEAAQNEEDANMLFSFCDEVTKDFQ